MTPEIRSIVVELAIQAPLHKVWRSLAHELPTWWPKDFVALPNSTMNFEPRAGGRLWEVAPDGSEILWGTVVLVKPDSTLEIVGHLTHSYSGPALTMWCIKLTADGDQTQFRLSDAIVGRIDDEQEEALRGGWTYLFTTGLKAYCEA